MPKTGDSKSASGSASPGVCSQSCHEFALDDGGLRLFFFELDFLDDGGLRLFFFELDFLDEAGPRLFFFR
jgi:hypothetical protein